MTQDNKPIESKEENKKPQDNTGVMMTGHIKIFDPETGEVIVDKRNAIHYENMSQALANSLANKSTGFVHDHFACFRVKNLNVPRHHNTCVILRLLVLFF